MYLKGVAVMYDRVIENMEGALSTYTVKELEAKKDQMAESCKKIITAKGECLEAGVNCTDCPGAYLYCCSNPIAIAKMYLSGYNKNRW